MVGLVLKGSLQKVVLPQDKVDAVTVESIEYTADMTVTDSDHKPVWSRLAVDLPVVIQDKKRRKCSELLQQCFQQTNSHPARISVSAETVLIQAVCARVQAPIKWHHESRVSCTSCFMGPPVQPVIRQTRSQPELAGPSKNLPAAVPRSSHPQIYCCKETLALFFPTPCPSNGPDNHRCLCMLMLKSC